MHTIFETDGPLATLTFNRPEARNAMTWEMYEALVDACERVDRDDTIRVPIARTLGNCLSGATYSRLIDLIGPAAVKDLLFTGRLVGGPEAHALGLVNRLVPAENIGRTVLELATEIASNAPLTLRAIKEMIRRVLSRRRLPPGDDADLVELCYMSHDFREGVTAFLAKRKPQWSGR